MLQSVSIPKKPIYEIGPSTLHAVRFTELWHYRNLILMLARRQIAARYKQTIFGLLWAVILPAAFTLIFVLFAQIVSVQPAGALPYVPSTFAGLVLWQFFSRGLTDAGTSLTANSNLITKIYFPRIVLPISAVLSALFDVVVSFLILIGVLIFYQTGFSGKILWAPLFVAQVGLIVLASGLWLSAIDGIFRDLRHALPLMLQLGMFISPVAYTTSVLVSDKWRWLYELNPMVAPIEGMRWALFSNSVSLDPAMQAKSLAVTTLFLLTGAVFFARMERTVVDRV